MFARLAQHMLALSLTIPSSALACPDCYIGRAARARVLSDPAPERALIALLLPFAISFVVAALLHRGAFRLSRATHGKERSS